MFTTCDFLSFLSSNMSDVDDELESFYAEGIVHLETNIPGRVTPRLAEAMRQNCMCPSCEWPDVSVFSIFDCSAMRASWFLSDGEIFLEHLGELCTAVLSTPSASSQPLVSGPMLMVPGARALFSEKRPRLQAWEHSALGGGEGSSKSAQQSKVEKAADLLLSRMDDQARERFLPGYGDLPKDTRLVIIKRAVRNLAGSGSLACAASFLARADQWLTSKFGPAHGFVMKPAVVDWFFLDNLVQDDLDGHVSQSLYSGGKFVSSNLKFPIEMSDKSVAAFAKKPSAPPKQAPSVSVRLLRHFLSVASCVDFSRPLRAVSGAYVCMTLAGLRGIDAMRSAFDAEHRAKEGYFFFSAVAWDCKAKQHMPWACPLSLFSFGESWFTCLKEMWGDRDYMFPSIGRGQDLASATMAQFCSAPASAYMLLRYLREILQLFGLMAADEAERWRRHSFRHFVANALGILKFDITVQGIAYLKTSVPGRI